MILNLVYLFEQKSYICSICLIIIKDLSIFDEEVITMNLHEECLLKYLQNPVDLFRSTEMLKLNNALIEKGAFTNLAKKRQINYTANRI